MSKRLTCLAFIVAAFVLAFPACAGGPSVAPVPTPTVSYSQYQLEYRLLASYSNYFWCDPDFYPVARVGQEEKNSTDQFAAIQSNQAEFSSILEHLGLPEKGDYSASEKLSIYREHKKLTYVIQMSASGNSYQFSLRIGQGQGQRIEGAISSAGQVSIVKQEASFNTCPVCLTYGTLIDTPSGQSPVENIMPGMTVWSPDYSGLMVAAQVKEIARTPVPEFFEVAKIKLSDGRSVTASPGHPAADGRAVGSLLKGDRLDGSVVTSVEWLDYGGRTTADLLPDGPTGSYWANGILLKSTLFGR